MPDQSDHENDRKLQEEFVENYNADHEGLISNPDLRAAFNEALVAGLSEDDAHVLARIDEGSNPDEHENVDDWEEETRTDGRLNMTLGDWADEDLEH